MFHKSDGTTSFFLPVIRVMRALPALRGDDVWAYFFDSEDARAQRQALRNGAPVWHARDGGRCEASGRARFGEVIQAAGGFVPAKGRPCDVSLLAEICRGEDRSTRRVMPTGGKGPVDFDTQTVTVIVHSTEAGGRTLSFECRTRYNHEDGERGRIAGGAWLEVGRR